MNPLPLDPQNTRRDFLKKLSAASLAAWMGPNREFSGPLKRSFIRKPLQIPASSFGWREEWLRLTTLIPSGIYPTKRASHEGHPVHFSFH
jgi:hypothetical protein